ncbi:MAG: acyl-CoA thioesterase II [Gemmatimonadota bacterium]|nr:acyl-CoA thioesterase II [Gemmatimonadota bacterium]
MSEPLRRLVAQLELEPLEVNIYRGTSRDLGAGRVFGGQVLAQALAAARHTVDDPRDAHSLHGYFILPGDVNAPIVYFVDRLRDGGSFTTRSVTAIQHGKAIFNLAASFHREEEGVEHQASPPEVPAPESLEDERTLFLRRPEPLPERLRVVLMDDQPIDFRPVDPVDPLTPAPHSPLRRVWFRARGKVEGPPALHQAILAYASDYGLLTTALMPHAMSLYTPNLQVASLDHSLWFHRSFRVDEWLLYVVDSPSASGARGFARGSIFDRAGNLVASVAQEGLVRLRG